MRQIIFGLLIVSAWSYGHAQSSLPPCPADAPTSTWTNCTGTFKFSWGASYVGEWKDGKFAGQGTYTYEDGRKHVGMFRGVQAYGQGTLISPKGYTLAEGFWQDNLTVDTSGGRWVLAGGSEFGPIFVLTRSIRSEGMYRRAWVMKALPEPDPEYRWLSGRELEKFDCKGERTQIITATFFLGPFGSGEVLNTFGEREWDYAQPGSVSEAVLKYVCDYKLTSDN